MSRYSSELSLLLFKTFCFVNRMSNRRAVALYSECILFINWLLASPASLMMTVVREGVRQAPSKVCSHAPEIKGKNPIKIFNSIG